MKRLIALSFLLLINPARAETQLAHQLEITDFSGEASGQLGTQDHYWWSYFAGDLSVALHLDSFAGHVTINRPASSQGIGILYADNLCVDVASTDRATVSRCPAVITRYRSGQPPIRERLETAVCLVRNGAHPSRDAENAAMYALRHEGGASQIVFSAILKGEPVSDCTAIVSLGER